LETQQLGQGSFSKRVCEQKGKGKRMSKYTITITNRYEVEADSPEHALASYRVVFDEADPEILGIDFWQVIPQDQFEYLDGKGEAVESIPEMS
jgi:hypothetical protein